MISAKFLAKCVSLFLGVLVVTGCAINNSATSAPADVVVSESDSIIAQDFVNIMVQVESLSPSSTVLKFGDEEGSPSERDARSIQTNNAFGRALRVAARKSGYALETVEIPTDKNYVSFSIAEFGDAVNGTTYTYDLSVGEIDFRRVYKPLEDGGIEPVKAMLVRGVDVSQLETDDALFAKYGGASLTQTSVPKPESTSLDTSVAKKGASEKTDASVNDIVTNTPSNAAVLERPVVVAAPLIADLPKDNFENSYESSNDETGTVAQSLVGNDLSTGFETIRKINIALTGESNYETLLVDKEDVAEETLIFADDSYVLGTRNKEILNNMMTEFNPVTDVVSVVGCSTGVTKIANGNAALAIGRANRVKEALLYTGIPHDKIYDEGCWSPTANSTPFPNRGVVVTVKRTSGKS